MICPTCGETNQVRELVFRTTRQKRKQERTGSAKRLRDQIGVPHMWECARCNKGWFTWTKT